MALWKSKREKRRDDFGRAVGEFATLNRKYKGSLMIMADPETNVVIGAYQGQIGGFENKSRIHTIKDLFVYDADDDQKFGSQSKRNRAIYQLLFEIDGIVDSLGKKLYNLKKGRKALEYLERKGELKFGEEKVNEKGNTEELVIRKR